MGTGDLVPFRMEALLDLGGMLQVGAILALHMNKFGFFLFGSADKKISFVVDGSTAERCAEHRKQIGVFSASFLIFNRIIGTGIFATPSMVLSLTGSVAMSLMIWVIGTLIAMVGTAVYLEFGTAIPRYV